jgi:uncharacterized protein DUF3592
MILFTPSTWETATALVLAAAAAACAVLWFRRRRPTAEEIERARRLNLAVTGRLVDGMLLDVRMMPVEEGRTLTMLEYSYRIGGVEYECCQDVTAMSEIVNPAEVRAGFPCSVRYLPGSPQNSIVVAEEWSGLRVTLPKLSAGANLAQGNVQEKSPQAS